MQPLHNGAILLIHDQVKESSARAGLAVLRADECASPCAEDDDRLAEGMSMKT
jgi:hypothetical protein